MHVIGVIHTLNLSKQKYLGITLHQLMKWPKGSTRSCPFVVPVDALMTGSLALTHTPKAVVTFVFYQTQTRNPFWFSIFFFVVKACGDLKQ
jgi:hypothetical protein